MQVNEGNKQDRELCEKALHTLLESYPRENYQRLLQGMFKSDFDERIGYTLFSRSLRNIAFIEHLYVLGNMTRKEIKKTDERERFLDDLEKLTGLWVKYFLSLNISYEVDFLILRLLHKIKHQSDVVQNLEEWNQLIGKVFHGIFARAKVVGLDPTRNYLLVPAYEQAQNELLEILVSISDALKTPLVKMGKADAATRGLLSEVKIAVQDKLINHIKFVFTTSEDTQPVLPFNADLYGDRLQQIAKMAQDFLLSHPFKATDLSSAAGVSFKNILTALCASKQGADFAVLGKTYEFIFALIQHPETITQESAAAYFRQLPELPEYLPMLLEGLGFNVVIESKAVNHIFVRLSEVVFPKRLPNILSKIGDAFLKHLEEVLQRNGFEKFFQAVESGFYFLFVNKALPEALVFPFQERVHALITQFCNQQFTEKDCAEYFSGKKVQIWEDRCHPQSLEGSTVAICDTYLAQKIQSMEGESFHRWLEELNQLKKMIERLEAKYSRIQKEYLPAIKDKQAQYKQLSEMVISLQEEKEKFQLSHDKEIAELETSKTEVSFFRKEQKLKKIEETIQENTIKFHEILKKQNTVIEEKNIELRALKHHLKEMQEHVSGAKLLLENPQIIGRAYLSVLRKPGSQFHQVLLKKIDQYLKFLSESESGLQELHELTHGLKQGVILALPEGVEFSVNQSLKRLFSEKLHNIIVHVAANEIKTQIPQSEIDECKKHLSWVEIEEVLLQYVRDLKLAADPKKSYKNLIKSDLLNILFPELRLAQVIKSKLKKIAFQLGIFKEIEFYNAIKKALENYNQPTIDETNLLVGLDEGNAKSLSDFIPEAKLQQLLEFSVTALQSNHPYPRHFYAAVLHAFILKIYATDSGQIGGAIFTNDQALQVLAIYPIYQRHIREVQTLFATPLSDAKFTINLSTALQALIELNGFQTQAHFVLIAKDANLLNKILLQQVQRRMQEPGFYAEKLAFCREVLSYLTRINAVAEKKQLFFILQGSLRQWLENSSWENLAEIVKEVQAYQPLVEVFSEFPEHADLNSLLTQSTERDHWQNKYHCLDAPTLENAYQYALTHIDAIAATVPQDYLRVEVHSENIDDQLFDPKYVALLGFGLPASAREELSKKIQDKKLKLPQQCKLLRNLMDALEHCLYDDDRVYTLSTEIDAFLLELTSLGANLNATDIKLVLVYGDEKQVNKLQQILKSKLQNIQNTQERSFFKHIYPQMIIEVYDLGINPYRGYAITPPLDKQVRLPVADALSHNEIVQTALGFEIAQFYHSACGNRKEWDGKQTELERFQQVHFANSLANTLLKILMLKKNEFLSSNIFKILTGVELSTNLIEVIFQWADERHKQLLQDQVKCFLHEFSAAYVPSAEQALSAEFSVSINLSALLSVAQWELLGACVREISSADLEEMLITAANYVAQYCSYVEEIIYLRKKLGTGDEAIISVDKFYLFASSCQLMKSLGKAEQQARIDYSAQLILGALLKAQEQERGISIDYIEFVTRQLLTMRYGLLAPADASYEDYYLAFAAKKIHEIHYELESVKRTLHRLPGGEGCVVEIEESEFSKRRLDLVSLMQLLDFITHKLNQLNQPDLIERVNLLRPILDAISYAQSKINSSADYSVQQQNVILEIFYDEYLLAIQLQEQSASDKQVIALNKRAQLHHCDLSQVFAYYMRFLSVSLLSANKAYLLQIKSLRKELNSPYFNQLLSECIQAHMQKWSELSIKSLEVLLESGLLADLSLLAIQQNVSDIIMSHNLAHAVSAMIQRVTRWELVRPAELKALDCAPMNFFLAKNNFEELQQGLSKLVSTSSVNPVFKRLHGLLEVLARQADPSQVQGDVIISDIVRDLVKAVEACNLAMEFFLQLHRLMEVDFSLKINIFERYLYLKQQFGEEFEAWLLRTDKINKVLSTVRENLTKRLTQQPRQFPEEVSQFTALFPRVCGDNLDSWLMLIPQLPSAAAISQAAQDLFILLNLGQNYTLTDGVMQFGTGTDLEIALANFNSTLVQAGKGRAYTLLTSLTEIVTLLEKVYQLHPAKLMSLRGLLQPKEQDSLELQKVKRLVMSASDSYKLITVESRSVNKLTRLNIKKLLEDTQKITAELRQQRNKITFSVLHTVLDFFEQGLPQQFVTPSDLAQLYNHLCESMVMLNYCEQMVKTYDQLEVDHVTVSPLAKVLKKLGGKDSFEGLRTLVDEFWKKVIAEIPELKADAYAFPSCKSVPIDSIDLPQADSLDNFIADAKRVLLMQQRPRLVLLLEPLVAEAAPTSMQQPLLDGVASSQFWKQTPIQAASPVRPMPKSLPEQRRSESPSMT